MTRPGRPGRPVRRIGSAASRSAGRGTGAGTAPGTAPGPAGAATWVSASGSASGADLDSPGRAPADRWYRYLAWPVLATAGTFAGLYFTGAPLWRSAMIAVTIGLTLFGVSRALLGAAPEWPLDGVSSLQPPARDWEVQGLEAARQRSDVYDRVLQPRLWALATELLRRRGVDPRSPQAAALLGQREHALLCGDVAAEHAPAMISRLCAAIAHLAVDPPAGGAPPIRAPGLAGLAGHAGPSRTTGSARGRPLR